MDATKNVPSKLSLDLKSQVLKIVWADGHASEYGAGYLRFNCPCAGCRGHAPGDVEPPAWDACKGVTIVDASQVGGYAIQFSFSDGHATGIYAYDRLRSACPCVACSGRGG